MSRLAQYWYARSPVVVLLLPLSGLYALALLVRRGLYRAGALRVHRPPAPVVVVGNLTVGGTGKTPLVIWLARYLSDAGYHPGILSRGYGGRARHWPQQVRPDSDPEGVGDEPVVLARRTGCPVAVDPDRSRAARELLAHAPCDVLVCDDGLQHYALAHDVEILVVDGVRRFGNGLLLPAGPLRESLGRLRTVDAIVVNGLAGRGEYVCRLEEGLARNLMRPDETRSLDSFADGPVHAVAGIGNPERFFESLERAGLTVERHPFADHHSYSASDLAFDDDRPVLMTEKDAVKCERFARPEWWYVPVEAHPDSRLGELVLRRLRSSLEERKAESDTTRVVESRKS